MCTMVKVCFDLFYSNNSIFLLFYSCSIMAQKRKVRRCRYLMKSQREREHEELIEKEYNFRDVLTLQQAASYIKLQGYHIDVTDIANITRNIYGTPAQRLNVSQIIGVIARLSIDEELERQMRKIFKFFSHGEERLGLNELKHGLIRLGENLKERQINCMLIDLDLNSNGFIDFETFLQAMVIQ